MTVPKIKRTEKFQPDDHGWLQPLMQTEMSYKRLSDGHLPTAAGTRLRGSYAMTCSRQMAFGILGLDEDIPVPPEILFAFDIGHKIHESFQKTLISSVEAEVEVVGDWTSIGVDMSVHADAVWDLMDYPLERPDTHLFTGLDTKPNTKVTTELKSMSGYGWLIAVGARNSDEGPGPKPEHICQSGFAALAPNINAQYVHLVYFDKDKHGIAEWMFDVDEPLPAKYEGLTIRELVAAELTRMEGILGRIDNEQLPARHIPGFGRVTIPARPDSKDQPWNCRYCRWQPTCATMEHGPVSIELVRDRIPEVVDVPVD